MADKHIKILRYYFLSGAIEGLLALIILFFIPSDPKNIWLFGFSKTRWISASGILFISIVFGWLTLTFGKKANHLRIAQQITETAYQYSFIVPATLLAGAIALFVPYAIVTSPILTTWQGIQIRILPMMLFLLTRIIQTLFVWTLLSRQTHSLFVQATDAKNPILTINPRKISVVLACIAGVLVLTSANLDWIDTFVGGQQLGGFRVKFDLDQETSIPSYFSSIILLITAFLFGIIGLLKTQSRNRFARHWVGLSFILLFMSADESAALHEKLINIFRNWIRPTGFFYYGWVIAAIPIILILAFIYLRFFLHLPRNSKRGIISAGFLYVSGAVGLEMVGGWFADRYGDNHIYDNLLITGEESLEMFGIIVLISALLTYLEENYPQIGFQVQSDQTPFTNEKS